MINYNQLLEDTNLYYSIATCVVLVGCSVLIAWFNIKKNKNSSPRNDHITDRLPSDSEPQEPDSEVKSDPKPQFYGKFDSKSGFYW